MGAAFGLRLTWTKCPDGVELVGRPGRSAPKEPQANVTVIDMEPEAGWEYRNRSEKVATVEIAPRANLRGLIVLDFVNATTDQRRLDFLDKHGHPFGEDRLSGEAAKVTDAATLRARQQDMRSYLIMAAGEGDASASVPAVNQALGNVGTLLSPSFEIVDGEARVVLRPKSLWQYMVMEVASAALHGVRYSECEHCGDAYLTGPMTGRTSYSKYCSSKCRMAALRARNALLA
jgi:hypothetical protein